MEVFSCLIPEFDSEDRLDSYQFHSVDPEQFEETLARVLLLLFFLKAHACLHK